MLTDTQICSFIARSLNECAKKIRAQRAFLCPLQNMSQAVPAPRGVPATYPAAPQDLAAGLGRERPGAGSPHTPAESWQKGRLPSPEVCEQSCCRASRHRYQLSPSNPWHFAESKVPLAQHSVSGRVRGGSGRGNHMSLAVTCWLRRVFPSQKYIWLRNKKVFMKSEQ